MIGGMGIGVVSIVSPVYISEIWCAMLGMEFFPALLFIIMIFFVPESPRWLILKNSIDKSRSIIYRIHKNPVDAENEINAVRESTSIETKSEWALLLKPGIFKAVTIGVAIAMLGQFMGVNVVLYYGPTIFEESGLAMLVAGISLWIGTYLIGQLTPWLLENLTTAGTFFLFAAMYLPYLWIMWKKIPETTGKSLEEIEKFWLGTENRHNMFP